QPFAVYLRFARPEGIAGAEMCHRADRLDGKTRVRPAGPKGVNGFLTVSLSDPRATLDGRHPAADLGIGKIIDRLGTIASREKALNNPVEAFTAEFQFAGRPVIRYEVFTRRPH